MPKSEIKVPLFVQFIERRLEDEFYGGDRWPDDAKYAVLWRTYISPEGWSPGNRTAFFSSMESLQTWMERKKKAEFDFGDDVAWVVFKWGTGIERMPKLDRNANHV